MNNSLSRDYFSRTAGIAMLVAITLFTGYWMSAQNVAPTVKPLPQSLVAAHPERFRADLAYLPNESLLGFVEIPAGSFAMGSDPAIDRAAYDNERWSKEQTQGTVMLPTFYIGRYEVTVAQYREFVMATGQTIRSAALQVPADYPITDVSWTDALAYARWLQTTLRSSPQTPPQIKSLLDAGWTLTLPSEAQWEKAARGTDGRIFPWGNEPSNAFANFSQTGVKAVGSFACSACAFQLADMSGSVWELTRSPYRPYPYSTSDADKHADALYVMRGGAFNETLNNIRAATRGGIDPGARRSFIGFRLVLTK
jgi:formylglycine-generating enzyme required for sulfatase activity